VVANADVAARAAYAAAAPAASAFSNLVAQDADSAARDADAAQDADARLYI